MTTQDAKLAQEAAEQLRRLLAAVAKGELVAPAGLVARLEGAAAAWEALGERPRRRVRRRSSSPS